MASDHDIARPVADARAQIREIKRDVVQRPVTKWYHLTACLATDERRLMKDGWRDFHMDSVLASR